ncbi:hypothetical protein ACROYT_G021833 [Oculina patagonica]
MNCSFGSEDSPCSLDGLGSVILPLLACKRDMTFHLVSLGISGKRGRGKTEVSESQLILNRAGLPGALNNEEMEAMTICPKHRRDLTTDWSGRNGELCCYPTHEGTRKRIKLPRRVNAVMSAEISALFNVVVPIGAAICTTCRLQHYKDRKKSEPDNVEGAEKVSGIPNLPYVFSCLVIGVTVNVKWDPGEHSTLMQCEELESTDFDDVTEDDQIQTEESDETVTLTSLDSENSEPEEEVSIWCDEKELQNERRQALNDALGNLANGRFSPIRSTLNASWDDIPRPSKNLLQDVAFGTKTLKLDSGERIVIPAVIRTLIPSRIIHQYTSYCKEQEFEPASERSLFRMLEICSASMQKSLHGLDNITAEGTEAFDNLLSTIETLMENGADEHWAQKMGQAMKEAKRYFKTDFKAHVGKGENSSDHCTVYALSDPTNLDFRVECQYPQDTGCDRCESLDMVLEEITKKLEEVDITEDQKARMKFENKAYIRAVHAWKAHLIRSVNQEEAKQDALGQLNEETCLIIID